MDRLHPHGFGIVHWQHRSGDEPGRPFGEEREEVQPEGAEREGQEDLRSPVGGWILRGLSRVHDYPMNDLPSSVT